MATFDNKTVQLIQNVHFHTNVLEFVLGCIPSFDAKFSAMKTNVVDTPSNPRWNFLIIVPFKTLITQRQDQLTLGHMKNNNNMESSQ